MASPKDFRKDITEKLVSMLERGEAPPWRKPWDAGALQVPKNAVTGKPYRGSNAYFLMMAGAGRDHRWLTSAQLHGLADEQLKAAGVDARYEKNEKDAKGNLVTRGRGWVDAKTNEPVDKALLPRVKKGAEFQPVEFWKFEREAEVEKADGTRESVTVRRDRPYAQLFYVYNLADIENLTLPRIQEQASRGHDHSPVAEAERVIAATGAVIEHHQSDQAYYSPREDVVRMPPPEAFPSREAYYAVALHELGHWTSHPDRLDRDLSEYATNHQARAKEELRAELTSVFVGAELGVMPDLSNHGAYLASWAEALKKDPNELFRAASDAQKMADFVLGRERELENSKAAGQGKEGLAMTRPQELPDGSVQVLVVRRDVAGKALDSLAVTAPDEAQVRAKARDLVERAGQQPEARLATLAEQKERPLSQGR